MSLVSHYLQADDGNWYQDPVLGEEDSWFICFDDDDPPELVIRCGRGLKLSEILAQVPFLTISVSHGPGVSRMFKDHFHLAYAYFLRQVGTIPASRIFKHGGMTHEQPRCQGVFTPAFTPIQGKGGKGTNKRP